MQSLTPLSRLPVGRSARVGRIVGCPHRVHRLEEFGLRDGTTIEMFRQGNPCIVRVGGNKVCLRTDDRLDVLVTPLGQPL